MRLGESGSSSSSRAAAPPPQHDEHPSGLQATSGASPAPPKGSGQVTLGHLAQDGTDRRVLAQASQARKDDGFFGGLYHRVSQTVQDADKAVEGAGQWVADKAGQVKQGFNSLQDGVRADAQRRGGLLGAAEGFVSTQADVGAGFVFGAADLVGSTAKLAYGASQLTNPVEWAFNPQANISRVQTTGQAAVALGSVTSPVMWAVQPEKNAAIAKSMWDGVSQGYREGNVAQGVGRAVFDVGSLFVGVGEVRGGLKATEVAADAGKAAEVASDVARGGEAIAGTQAAEDASKGAAAGADAAEAADASKAAKADGAARPPSVTEPTGQPGGRPTGKPADAQEPGLPTEKRRGLRRENESADLLADKGYQVEQNPPTLPNGKNPDFKIEGEHFDALAPKSSNIDQVRKGISNKVREEQASRIVVNLNDTSLTMAELQAVLQRKPIEGLQEVIAIKGTEVKRLLP